MLSTRGGRLRLWVWNRRTRGLRPLSRGDVRFSLAQRNVVHDQPFIWLDSRHLLFTGLPRKWGSDQGNPYEYMMSRTPLLATRSWRRYLRGRRSTASVIDDLRDPGPPPGGDLILTDLSGHQTIVAHDVNTLLWQVSPTRDAVAFTRQVRTMPKPAEDLQAVLADGGVWKTEIRTINGSRISVSGEEARDVIPTSLHWSPDGRVLAYLGYSGPSRRAPWLYLFNVRAARIVTVKLSGLNASIEGRHPTATGGYQAPGVIWAANGQVLIRAARVASDTGGRDSGGVRQDWWLISSSGSRKCLTVHMRTVPSVLWPEVGRTRFFGIAGGDLWQIDATTGEVTDLSARLRSKIIAPISPGPELANLSFVNANRSFDQRTYDRAVVLAETENGEKAELFDLHSGKADTLTPPVPQAQLVSAGPHVRSFVYVRDDRNGLYLWRVDGRSAKPELLFSANLFLRGVAQARLTYFSYTGLEGNALNAWLLLPLGYRPGRRYPMITFFYPTYTYSAPAVPSGLGFYTDPSSDTVYNMQIAAAKGYAVLFPSVPLPYRQRDLMNRKVYDDVLPAVAAAIRRGFADPHELAIWGVSYGGSGVYGLVTRTDRFRAAIVTAGDCDLISAYGQLDPTTRYGNRAEQNFDLESILESGQTNMGGPPWRHWSRYIRNSPIFSVALVHTPLLITDGDLDFVPMQQSEEFFRALARQGKPVRLIRYWGEGHLLTDPPNIREYWRQVFSWLQKYLKAERAPGACSHPSPVSCYEN
jgi:dipeptidyl aminopeptidase/acylaminoacyl peptidase